MEPQTITDRRNVVVLGGGPAGVSAVVEVARAGSVCTLIDEHPLLGGQIFRQLPVGFRAIDEKALGKDYANGQRLLRRLAEVQERVEVWADTSVLGIENGREVVWATADRSGRLTADQIVIAPGAYERPVPFPGWTLPGVMQAGGVQAFIKTFGVRPGRRALVAGTGPLLLVVANQLHKSGVEVVAVLEAGRPSFSFDAFRKVWSQWRLLGDAGRYVWGLRKAGIPLLFNHTVFQAHGDGPVAAVTYGPVDPDDWRPRRDEGRAVDVDLLVVGFGFVPNSELTFLAGCRHEYRHELGGWIPIRDPLMRTSVPGVFAVGDGAGVAGVLVAVEQGQVAGITAAEQAGAISAGEAERRRARPLRRLASLARVRQVLDEVSRVRPGLCDLATSETLVCRCEEVALASLQAAINEGARDLQAVKLLSRLGMGACQGRNCEPSTRLYMCRTLGRPPEEVGRINPRFPVRPVTLGAMAHMIVHADANPGGGVS